LYVSANVAFDFLIWLEWHTFDDRYEYNDMG